MYETRLFNVEELETALVQKTLNEVYDALEERRQRQEKIKQKAEIFKDKKAPER